MEENPVISVSEADVKLPVLYSKRVVFFFSALVVCFAGSILLYKNLRVLKKKKEAFQVLVFGILYTVSVFAALSLLESLLKMDSYLTLILNIVGAMIQERLFFMPNMPEEYEKKSFVIPLVIALAITVPLIVLMIWANYYQV